MWGCFTSALVSAIIVNWNGLKYIRECIDSILCQTYPAVEIILIDNASSDGSADYVVKNYPAVKVIRSERNLGFAGGTNLGIKEAKGDLIALFNQDAVAERTWLEKLVNTASSSEDIGGVAGKTYYWDHKDKIFCTWAKVDPYKALAYNFTDERPMADVDYLPGCAMVIKRKALDEIGLLDADYFLYFEETDWCARAIRAGYRLVYVPDAIAWHVVSGSISDPYDKLAYITRNRIRFALKNYDLSYIPLFIGEFIGETIDEMIKGIRGKNYNGFKMRVNAIVWNVFNSINTFVARRRDLSRIKNPRSYNSSLPLRQVRWDY